MADPFGTEQIRQRVLAAWATSPARFREDANAEEDYALGGYRDRLVVELAQNAADAAVRAGVPGLLRLTFDGTVLRAANVGSPLDAAGVQALSTLRASAKRGETEGGGQTVGRFGVGFAAVLAVCDEPAVHSTTGGVRFSRTETAQLVSELPTLAEELALRHGEVPALRLPWPAPGVVPEGFDTEVVLPIRPESVDVVAAALQAVPAELLLGLPGLHRLQIGDRVLTARRDGSEVELADGGSMARWRLHEASGTIPAELLAGRPTEERARDAWTITWAVPLGTDGAPVPVTGGVLHAPTPSDEPVSLPARLIGTVPLDPDRRHVAPGPLTDHLIDRAAEGYAALLTGFSAAPEVLGLVPRPTLAASAFDAALVDATLTLLRRTPFLSTVDESVTAPAAAVALDGIVPDAFADVLDGLLPLEWSVPRWSAALRALEVRRLAGAELVEELSTVDRPPDWWHAVYDALAESPDREALEGLPVPLSDGRTVTGPRGLLLPDVELPPLDALGLRLVARAAVHPLLERLGAQPATAHGLLADERIAAQVEMSIDAEDPEPLVDAVLALVGAAGAGVGELPWLAQLALPGADGDWYPAGEMLSPDGELAGLVEDDAPFGRPDPELLERCGADTLEAVGVLRGFAVLRAEDVDPVDADLELDGESEWYDTVLDAADGDSHAIVSGVAAIRDLELVRADAWPAALRLLGGPDLRPTVLAPARAVLDDGRTIDVPSYTRWWLRTHPVLDGQRPDRLRTAAATDLAGLYETAPVDADLAELVGVRTGLADVLDDIDALPDLLLRLGDPERTVPAAVLHDIYARIADAARDFAIDPPARVRVAADRVAPVESVVVLDCPYVLPLISQALVQAGGAAEAVADLLDVPLASGQLDDVGPDTTGDRTLWTELPGVSLAAARCGGAVPDSAIEVHSGLSVAGKPVAWWPADGVDHVDAAAGPDALGRALAWRLGRWDRRAAATEALRHPDRAAAFAAEDGCEASRPG